MGKVWGIKNPPMGAAGLAESVPFANLFDNFGLPMVGMIKEYEKELHNHLMYQGGAS
jgi:hypothetical protein